MCDHHRPGGGFRNPWRPPGEKRFGGFLRWVLIERPFKPLPPDPDPSVFTVAEPAFPRPRAGADLVTVTWVGHSTTLLQVGGANVLTDPIWSDRATPVSWAGPGRWVRPGITFDGLPAIDVVLISHNHYDHLDDRTVRAIARHHPAARWLVPLGIERFVRRRGVERVEQLDWWAESRVAGLRISCTPAQHFSGRGLLDRNATLWCGWAIAGERVRVLFAGDTGYHPEFPRIAERYGPFDLSLIPIGAYEPRWFMRAAHLSPEDAVRAFGDLSSGSDVARHAMVPIHWGTFKLTDEPMDEPPERTRRAWSAAGLEPESLWLLAHGETRMMRVG